MERCLEDERRWLVEEGRRQEHAERVKRLMQQVTKWSESQSILAYVAAARSKLAAQITQEGELDQWLRWCESYAEEIDPLITMDSSGLAKRMSPYP